VVRDERVYLASDAQSRDMANAQRLSAVAIYKATPEITPWLAMEKHALASNVAQHGEGGTACSCMVKRPD
jgi:hypothetical protein